MVTFHNVLIISNYIEMSTLFEVVSPVVSDYIYDLFPVSLIICLFSKYNVMEIFYCSRMLLLLF